ncbi:MAG: STAS domain-containing protein [Steroidobacteraceae bacterium]
MAANKSSLLAHIVTEQESSILSEWNSLLRQAGTLQTGRITDSELQMQCRELLQKLRAGLSQGFDAAHPAFTPAREMLTDISRSRALQGFSPRETATFVLSLKQPIFNALMRTQNQAANLPDYLWQTTLLLDELGLMTMEAYQKAREEVIIRQQREIAELSTPVVKLWDGVLALPLIGTLDSERTQVVMENLLQSIVDQSAQIAIIDITGVPTVDTLTAQHLLKTIAAARLMGADCIISGIRPQIAQTMVHLGVELNVISKATLADAFAVALRRMNRTVAVLKGVSSTTDARS